ncbi:MAG: hypothetical protein PVF18_09185 [Anaerolineales bacterium]
MIQYNAIRSWLALGDDAEVLLIGEEPGLYEAAAELNIQLLPVKQRASSGAPFINELFQSAQAAARNPILGYLNADIMLLDDFLPVVSTVSEHFSHFLIVGNRYDLDVDEELTFDGDWIGSLRQMITQRGLLHKPMGSDYFIFRKGQFQDIPEFVLGRSGWDNWMMYEARHEDVPMIDASGLITVVHQNHDYAHLPGGKPHYRHPESERNIRLAGGYETMFRLRDADWLITSAGIHKKRFVEWEWPRKIEADIIASVGAGLIGKLTRMLFHPRDALSYISQKFLWRDRQDQIVPRDHRGSS